MEKSIQHYIDSLFCDLPDVPDVREAKAELAEKVLHEYYYMVKDGYDKTVAFQKAIENIGDVSGLKIELTKKVNNNPRVSALPKSIQDFASLDEKPNIKGSFRRTGNGKVVAIGCITGVIIFTVVIGFLIALIVRTVKSVSPDKIDDFDAAKPSQVINEIRDSLQDNDRYEIREEDEDSVSVNNDSVYVGKSWANDHISFDTEYNSSGEYTISAKGIHNIEIDWVAGDVLLVAEDRNDIFISEDVYASDPINFGVNNGTLYIYYRDKFDDTQRKMFIKSVTIKVPKDFLDGLDNIEIETVSGNSHIKDTEFYELDFETVSGNLILESVCCEVDFDSVSGDFTYIGGACPNEVDISTISGDSSFFLSEVNGFEIVFDTVSGDITSDFSLTKSYDTHYSFGNGFSKIEVESTSGNLILNKN